MRFSVRLWLYLSLGLLPLTIAAHIRTPGHVLDSDPLYLWAMPFGVALGGFYAHFSHCWESTPKKPPGWGRQLYDAGWLSILMTLLLGTLARCINIGFDPSPPQKRSLKVLHQHIAPRTRSSGSSLQLVFLDPFDSAKRFSVGVSDAFYTAHPVGSPIAVRLRRGALGAAWIEPLE